MLSGPEITGAGVGTMVIVLLIALSQPKLLVWVTFTVPAPAAPHNTLIELLVLEPSIAPPLTDQLYVLPAIAVIEYV